MRLDRIVALKIPRRERLTPNEVERFLAEPQAAAQLRHPSIVRIHDTGQVGPAVLVATDFAEPPARDPGRKSGHHRREDFTKAGLCAPMTGT